MNIALFHDAHFGVGGCACRGFCVESSAGKGSRFWLELPAAATNALAKD
jgi:hypothetical protein